MTEARLLTAVIETDSAVSPRARCVSRLAIVPPGAAPRTTSPTANAAPRPNSSPTANASSGEMTRRVARPIRAPRGWTSTRRKSAVVSDSPSVHMIRASATGSTTVARTEWSCIERAMVAGLGHGRLQSPGHRRVPRGARGDPGLRGLPAGGHALGAPAHVPGLRAHRLLRQLAPPPRDGAQRRHGPPDHPLRRARRGLELVLRGRADVPPHRGLAGERPEGVGHLLVGVRALVALAVLLAPLAVVGRRVVGRGLQDGALQRLADLGLRALPDVGDGDLPAVDLHRSGASDAEPPDDLRNAFGPFLRRVAGQ